MPKWCQNDVKKTPKWCHFDDAKACQDDAKMMSKWRQNDVKMMSFRWCQSVSRWRKNDVKMMPKWCQNDVKKTPKWCHFDDARMTLKDAKMMSKWCHFEDVRMVKLWFHFCYQESCAKESLKESHLQQNPSKICQNDVIRRHESIKESNQRIWMRIQNHAKMMSKWCQNDVKMTS